jgi:hypothetical protein
MSYIIHVDDNFHYINKDARYTHREYETLEATLKAAKEIVGSYLSSADTPGISAEDLYQNYTSLGDDPFSVGPEDAKFSARDYATAQCEVMCGTSTLTL